MNEDFKDALVKFLDSVVETYPTLGIDDYVEFEIHEGRRFARVQKIGKYGTHTFAFVDQSTGDIFRPATYRAPAKHARGNLFSEMGGREALSACNSHIRYL